MRPGGGLNRPLMGKRSCCSPSWGKRGDLGWRRSLQKQDSSRPLQKQDSSRHADAKPWTTGTLSGQRLGRARGPGPRQPHHFPDLSLPAQNPLNPPLFSLPFRST